MRIKNIMLLSLICSFALLAGCTTGPCGDCYYNYNYNYGSRCGWSSCTMDTVVVRYSSPCAGVYDCVWD